MPPSDGRDAGIVVSDFHPKWREAAQRLMKNLFRKNMTKYKCSVESWTNVPIALEFSEENGLTHVHMSGNVGLDLRLDGSRAPCYESHNIAGVPYTLAAVCMINHYIDNLRFVSDRLVTEDARRLEG